MRDLGLMITRRAAGRLLGALSNELYLLRLIHHGTRRALPGDRIWTGSQVLSRAGLGFLRGCNCEGYDIYFVRMRLPASGSLAR